ncbi:hypothetical protein [Lysobacter sp. CA196]|uniref:hypothetical protein n=1 Tax=Lysobacter sp. CA196 TaxID=3455606 RepID=UPI003F8D5A09
MSGFPNFPGFPGGNRPSFPGLGGGHGHGHDPLGLGLPGLGGDDHHGPGSPPGLSGDGPPGLEKPYNGGDSNAGGNGVDNHHGGDTSPVTPPSGTTPSSTEHDRPHNTPNVVSSGSAMDDQIAAYPSRLLPGQSMQSSGNTQTAFNQITQYPPPTLSERALGNSAGLQPALNRPVSADAVPGSAMTMQPSGVQTALLGNPSVAAATNAGLPAQVTYAAAPALAVPVATPNAVLAAPMTSALYSESLLAQQNLLNQLSMMQRLSTPPNVVPANVAAPASESIVAPTVVPLMVNAAPNDPRNLPLANDRLNLMRNDGPLNNAVYADSPYRRPLRRGAKVDNASLTYWLWALGRGGTHRTSHEAEPSREVLRALQWLFWVLTVVAYACLAMAVIILLPGGEFVSERATPGVSGLALFLGVTVAAGAWWLGRRLNRPG